MFLLFGLVLQDGKKLQSGKKPSLLVLEGNGYMNFVHVSN